MRWLFWVLLLANAAFFAWQVRHLQPPAPRPTSAAPIPGQVNRLLLLSELDTGELRERAPMPPAQPPQASAPAPPEEPGGSAEPQPPEEAVAAEPPPQPVCYSVGPLESEEDVDRVGAWLRSRGAETELRIGERREVSLYWVYFPPFPSLGEAVERRREMQEQGVEDIYVIPRGDMANAISLGVYSQRSSLERRLRELRGLGYEPSMVPRYKTTKASWFDAEFPADYAFPEDAFGERFPEVGATPAPCEMP